MEGRPASLTGDSLCVVDTSHHHYLVKQRHCSHMLRTTHNSQTKLSKIHNVSLDLLLLSTRKRFSCCVNGPQKRKSIVERSQRSLWESLAYTPLTLGSLLRVWGEHVMLISPETTWHMCGQSRAIKCTLSRIYRLTLEWSCIHISAVTVGTL